MEKLSEYLLNIVYCAVFIRCTTVLTRCHSLSFVGTLCHSLSLFVTRCTTHCHSLSLVVIRYHSLSFVVTRCHSLSLVVTRCTTRLSFYKRSVEKLSEYLPSMKLDLISSKLYLWAGISAHRKLLFLHRWKSTDVKPG